MQQTGPQTTHPQLLDVGVVALLPRADAGQPRHREHPLGADSSRHHCLLQRSHRLPPAGVCCSGLTDPVHDRRPAESGAVEQPPSAPQQRPSITKNDAAGEPWGLRAGVIAGSGCSPYPLTCRRRLMGQHRQEAGTAQRVRWALWGLLCCCWAAASPGSSLAECTGQRHACLIRTQTHSAPQQHRKWARDSSSSGARRCVSGSKAPITDPAACAFAATCAYRRCQHHQHWHWHRQQQGRCRHQPAPLRAVQVRGAELRHLWRRACSRGEKWGESQHTAAGQPSQQQQQGFIMRCGAIAID